MDRLLKLALLVVAIACASLYGYLFWSGRTPGKPGGVASPSSPARESIDLWTAYERARTVARESRSDAQPVSASTQWQATTEDAVLTGANQWRFGFYAPQAKQTLDVIVTPDSARLADQTSVRDAPATLAEGAWQDGPRDALLAFLARGGREFLEGRQQALVSVHLSNSGGEGPRWDVAALSMQDRSTLAIRIDAETLQVLSISSNDGET